MAEKIVEAKITFEEKGSGSGRTKDKESKETNIAIKEISKDLRKLIAGTSSGLLGGSSGLVKKISKAIAVGALAAGALIKGAGDALAATSPMGETLGDIGVLDTDTKLSDMEKMTDQTVLMLEDFEQTAEIVHDINIETGEVTKELVTGDVLSQRIINQLSLTNPLTNELSSALDEQLRKSFQLIDNIRKAKGNVASGAIATVTGADVSSATLVADLPSGIILRGFTEPIKTSRLGPTLELATSLGGKAE